MIVSGWVLTLENDAESRRAVLERLSRDPRMTCGHAHGLRLPVVAETETLADGEALCESLRALDGVAFVDVVSIDFEGAA